MIIGRLRVEVGNTIIMSQLIDKGADVDTVMEDYGTGGNTSRCTDWLNQWDGILA